MPHDGMVKETTIAMEMLHGRSVLNTGKGDLWTWKTDVGRPSCGVFLRRYLKSHIHPRVARES